MKQISRRMAIIMLACGCLPICTISEGKNPSGKLDSYFSVPSSDNAKPDDEGFVRRWLALEPIDWPNRSNTVFTDSYLKEVFYSDALPGIGEVLPKDGKKEKVGKQTLKWHSLDSDNYNFKLFRFATGLEKQYYGIIFLVATSIDCKEEIKDVRMSVGSNSASMWWLDGEEILALSGDRRMVADDAMSRRITLKKGRNIIKGAIINGPGMSDFCLRFLKEDGTPVTDFTISNK